MGYFDYKNREDYTYLEDLIFNIIRNGNFIPYHQLSVVDGTNIEHSLLTDEVFLDMVDQGYSDRELKSYIKSYIREYKSNKNW